MFEYTYEAFWDPTTCRMLFIGSGHLAPTKFLTYSASDNLWTQAPDPYFLCPIRDGEDVAWGCVGHAYGFQAMFADRGVFYYGFADGNVYGIDTGRLVLVGSDRLSLLDPSSGAWSLSKDRFRWAAITITGFTIPGMG